MGDADVHRALVKLTSLLEEANIPYAIAGAMALNEYGYRRVTTDVHVLLTREGLAAFRERILGRGYLEKFPGSKGLRDTENGVTIDVLIAGEYPGDGKPKAVCFPDRRRRARDGHDLALLARLPRQRRGAKADPLAVERRRARGAIESDCSRSGPGDGGALGPWTSRAPA